MQKKISLSESEKKQSPTFRRINTKFKEYWKFLFLLMGIYILSYLFWASVLSESARSFFESKGWNFQWWMILGVAILQGLLFSLDGFVTAWLKAPFNQMCYAVNDASEKEISYNEKDYIIKKATESNEHCKETLKKFGIITISQEIIRVFVLHLKAGDANLRGPEKDYGYLINISYLIPLAFAAISIFLIHRKLTEIKRYLSSHKQPNYTKKSLIN